MSEQREKTSLKISIIFVMIGLVLATFACGEKKEEKANSVATDMTAQVSRSPEIGGSHPQGGNPSMEAKSDGEAAPDNTAQVQSRLPRLVDLGADKCIPCKMMAPILEELKKEYAGKLQVDFIDVWKDPKAGRQYGIRVIPTQIFYDVDGKEISRHQGFMGKADILATFGKAGIDLGEK